MQGIRTQRMRIHINYYNPKAISILTLRMLVMVEHILEDCPKFENTYLAKQIESGMRSYVEEIEEFKQFCH